MARGAGEGPDDRRDPPPHRPPGEDGPASSAASERASTSRSARSGPATCSASGRATRSRSTASSSRASSTVDDVDAHRRADPGRGHGRRRGHRGDPEHDRLVRLPGDPGRAPRRRWPGSSSWSSGPRAARRRSSAWPTGSARSSSRSSWSSAVATFAIWFALGPEPRLTLALTRSSASSSSPVRARWASRRRPRSWSAPVAGAEAGILDPRRRARSRRPHRVDTVVFDKTGTLTLGRPAVADVVAGAGRGSGRAARPGRLARARERAPARRGDPGAGRRQDELGFRSVARFTALAGHGVEGVVDASSRVAEHGPHRQRPACSPSAASTSGPLAEAPPRRHAGGRTAGPRRDRRSAGRAHRGRRPGQGRGGRSRPRADRGRHRGLARHRRRSGRPPRPSPRQVGIPIERVLAEVLPGDKAATVERAPGRRAAGRDGRRRDQRRPGAGRRRPRRRDRDRRGRRDRGRRTSRSSAATRGPSLAAIGLSRRTMRRHPPEPVLGVRLQRASSSRSRWASCTRVRGHPRTRRWPPARWRSRRSAS